MAASVPICPRSMRAAVKNSGKRPHAMPSLRLLTRPAWLTLDRFRSPSVVRQKTSRGGYALGGRQLAVELRLGRDVVLRLAHGERTESARPSTTKPTPR
jgi:hypothetical protein